MKIRRALLFLIFVVPHADSYAEIGQTRFEHNKSARLERSFAPAPAPAEPDQAPIQQSLPPEKKKTLHGLGPDELFPGSVDNIPPVESKRRAPTRPRSSPRPSPTAAAMMDIQPSAPTLDAPPVDDRLRNSTRDAENFSLPASPSKKMSNELGLPILGLMSAATLIGLLFTIFKLRDLLRER